MLKAILRFSLANRMFVLLGALLLTLYGGYEMSRLPIDVFPDLTRPTVTVLTEAPGLSPEEVETLVTFPIETVLNGAAGVERVRSNSGVGLSIVYIEFGWDTDILQARQLVAEKLSLADEQLPEDISPQMGPISSIMGQVMLIGVTSDTMEPMEVRNLADWVIRPRLLTVPGVSQVVPIGGGRMQVHINVYPSKLRDFELTMEEVSEAVAEANRNTTGGYLDQGGQEWLVRNVGRIEGIKDLESSIIAYREGTPISLKHVATVTSGIQVKRGDASVNGSPAVILGIQKQPSADTVELTNRLEAEIENIRQSTPPGVKINDKLFRQANFITTAIDNVTSALKEAALLVSIVLILFLLNVRTTVISLIAIPVSFVVAGLFFKFMGISLNTMTLGGLAVAIGEMVDDAVVDVENIFRRLRENRALPKPKSSLRVVFNASNEIRSSLVYATLMMCIVFIPLFQLGGLEGRMFQPLGIAYIVSIVASLFVSLTVTPALASYLLPNAKFNERQRESPLVRLVKWIDTWQLKFTLSHPTLVMTFFYGLTLIAVYVFTHFGREFLPPFNEGTITVNMVTAPGTSLEESSRIGSRAEKLLLEVPEVVITGRRTGRAELDEHAEGVHSSEIEVDLRDSTRTREMILDDARERLSVLQGVVLNIGQPISHRLDHMLSGVNAQIAIKVFGDDLQVLRQEADRVHKAIASVEGLVDLSVEKQVPIPQVRIKLLRDQAARYGIRVGDLARTLESALYGSKVSEFLDNQRRYDIIVKFDEKSGRSIEELGELLVDTPTGTKVPLKAVADVFESEGPNTINRENVQRRIVVQANVSGRDVGSVVSEIQERVEAEVVPDLQSGYFISYEGQFEAQQEATRVIALLSMLSLALMYALLYNLFRVHRVVLAILFNIPLALIGAVVAVALTTQTFSIATLLGFITLTGISLRNGILMIEHYIHIMLHEGEEFSKEMIIRGSLERLVPVLMTACTTLLGLIPFAFAASGEPGKEILEPLAIVIFAGTLTSTLLDIVYTPAFFWRWCRPVVPKLLEAKKRSL